MATPESQPTVWIPTDTQYGLFYWIVLNKDKVLTHIVEISRACSVIQQTAQRVNDPTGLVVGVGFSSSLYQLLLEKKNLNPSHPPCKFDYNERRLTNNTEELAELPASDGDIFVHGKGLSVGTLYEFLRQFQNSMPEGVIDEEKTTVVQGFTYQHHRDVSGFIDGISNATTPEARKVLAVVPASGGSYVLTQRWEHDQNYIRNPDHQAVHNMEAWIGRERRDGKRLVGQQLQEAAHTNRMWPNNIVRQSLPFTEQPGTAREKSGLFFLAYANSTGKFDALLNEMVKGDGDMLFLMSTNTSGAYWYFPGMVELAQLG